MTLFFNIYRYFLFLSTSDEQMIMDVGMVRLQVIHCHDLLSQAQYHVSRARKKDLDDREIRRKQEEQREIIRIKQIEENKRILKELEKQKQQMLLKRQEYLEKTERTKMLFKSAPEKGKSKSRRQSNDALDSGERVTPEPGNNKTPRSSKANKSRQR